jgi:YbbR domain-containing protein
MSAYPEESIITVTYRTERIITRTFDLPVDSNIHFSGEASLADRRRQPMTEFVSVSLKAAEHIINALNTSDITGRADLVGLADKRDGEYDLPVQLTLPEGVELVGAEPVIRINMSSFEE